MLSFTFSLTSNGWTLDFGTLNFACLIHYTYIFCTSNAFLKNWLANLSDKVDGFKEMDLLQEHQNFWAKVACSSTLVRVLPT